MGREVRRVPKDWQHPRKEDGAFKPLLDGVCYPNRVEDWRQDVERRGLQAAIEYGGGPPDARDYMPVWSEAEADHLMMYEDTSEGTPISPAFKTPEELARWLADNKASAFAGVPASYEDWLATIHAGSAPSAFMTDGKMYPGVAMMRSQEDRDDENGDREHDARRDREMEGRD